jgi:hypothetical protein
MNYKLICSGNVVAEGDDKAALEAQRDAACEEQRRSQRLPESVLPQLVAQWSIVEN